MRYLYLILFILFSILGRSQAPLVDQVVPNLASPGEPVVINGSNFGTNIADNRVFFGSIEAMVTSASPTALEVEMPRGAQPGKVTVTNTVNQLSGQSFLDYYPSFQGGARIIHSTFFTRQDLDVPNPARSITTVDIDQDGWLDIVTASAFSISIYRNRGLGGTLDINSFDPRIDIDPALGNYLEVKYADIDNDGLPDLYFSVDVNPNGGVGIMRNTSSPGSISFENAINIPASNRISYVSAGDIDGDGRQELFASAGAACGARTDYLFMFQNLSTPGSLSFSSQVDISTNLGCGMGIIKVVDMNMDLKPDVVVQTDIIQANFVVYLNESTTGVINASSLRQPTVEIPGRTTLAVADLDKDDLPEVIYHGPANSTGLRSLKNNSTATNIQFSTESTHNSGMVVEGEIKVADINGDQKPDLIYGNDWSQDWISIVQNEFDGTLDDNSFREPIRFQTNSIYPVAIDIGDLNGDGRPDLMSANLSNFISIFENLSDLPPVINSLSTYTGEVGDAVTINGNNFKIGLLNNDVRFGNVRANIVVANSPTEITVEVPDGSFYGPVTVSHGNLTGKSTRNFNTGFGMGNASPFDQFSFTEVVGIDPGSDVRAMDIGDMDDDGRPDIVVRTDAALELYRNTSTGELENSSFSNIPTGQTGTNALFLDDVDGDNFLDLISQARLYQNNSANSVAEIEFDAFVNMGTFTEFDMTSADINKDGMIDVITSTASSNLFVHENVAKFGDFGNNGTGINATFLSGIPFDKGAVTGFVEAADLDGDGWDEIIGTNPTTNNLSIFLNLGVNDLITPNSFANPFNVPLGLSPGSIRAGDLDLDGKIDLVIAQASTDSSVTVLHNQSTLGSLAFDNYSYKLSAIPAFVRINDVDGDGKPEIVVANNNSTISVLKNNTASMDPTSFDQENVYTVSGSGMITDMHIADFDINGQADIAVATRLPNRVVVFRNDVTALNVITIDQEPFDRMVCEEDVAQFDVIASGTTNLTYQWQEDDGGGTGFVDMFDGTGVLGTDTETLQIFTSGAFLDGYRFRCVVSGDNALDVITQEAFLSITPLPASPSANNLEACNDNTDVILTASGGTDGDYRWYDGLMSPITGEVNSTFNAGPLSTDESFFVTLTDGICESMPVQIDVTVLEPVMITSQPQSLNVDVDDPINLSVTASGDNLSYQWSKDGIIISGATSDTYSIAAVAISDSGDYTCEVSNSCSSEISATAVVAVGMPGSGFDVSDQGQTLANGQVAPVDFGQTDRFNDLERTFEINNTGTLTIIVNDISTSDPVFTVTSLPSSVDASRTEEFQILLDASDVGVFTADVTVDTDAGLFNFPITGEVVEPVTGGEVIIYNALAPDGDGRNDFFKIENIETFPDNQVSIYNRWGNLVFEVRGYDNQVSNRRFEGIANKGSSSQLLEGTYYYVIEYNGIRKSGDLFLRR